MRKLTTLLFALLAIGWSNAPETDLEGLKAMKGEWQAGFDTRNAAAIAAVYADNGAVLPPNGATVRGRAAVEAFWVDFMSGGIAAQINDAEVYASGDLGYKVGRYVITDPGGTTTDLGKYVEVWRYAEGKWQILHDIFNSNMPLPAPPPVPDEEAEVLDVDEAEVIDNDE